MKKSKVVSATGQLLTVYTPEAADLRKMPRLIRSRRLPRPSGDDEGNVSELNPATIVKGGPGSGNFGHAGRPGEVGGSAPAGTAEPAWKPVMSPAEADRWSAGSKAHGMYFHNTTPEFADKIRQEGFKVSSVARPNYYGRGVYLTKDSGVKFYGDAALEVRVNVKNPYVHLPDLATTTQVPLGRISESPIGKEVSAAMDKDPTLSKAAAVTAVLQGMGYDSVITKEDEKIIVVFDPKNVTVVDRDAVKGGPGSGNFGHAGRPGEVGGSAPAGTAPDDASDYWRQLEKVADSNFHTFFREAIMTLPQSRWGEIPVSLIEETLGVGDLGELVTFERVTGQQISRDAIRGVFIDEYVFEDAMRSFERSDNLPTDLMPAAEWAKLPGADWQTVISIAKEYSKSFDTKLFLATLASDKNAKFSDIWEATGDYLTLYLNPSEIAGLISERGDPEGVQAFLANYQVAVDQLRKPMQDAVLPYVRVVDAQTGDEVPMSDGNVRMGSWFGENAHGEKSGMIGMSDPRDYSDRDEVNAKKSVVGALSRSTGDDFMTANDFVKQWAVSSNDGDMRSLGIQEIASETLGGHLTDWQRQQIEKVQASDADNHFVEKKYLFENEAGTNRAEAKDKIRTMLRSVYERTQAELKSRGIKNVTVYRGLKAQNDSPLGQYNVGDVFQVETNALSSWSLMPSVAQEFAGSYDGRVLSTTVPAEWVYSTPMTGPGCLNEEEIVIVGKQAFYVRVER